MLTLAPEAREAILRRVAQGIRERADDLTRIVAAEMGAPITFAKPRHVLAAAEAIEGYADAIGEIEWEKRVQNALVVREPHGVALCITPWNFPLLQVALKVPAAFAAGVPVILKPSEHTPLSAFAFAEVCAAAGMPAGALNVVTGEGPSVGERLVVEPAVRMISLTGSSRAGRRIAILAAPELKRVSLELGGKSASLLLDDLDEETFEKAVTDTARNCFANTGQGCGLLTRLLVPRRRLRKAEDVAAAAAKSVLVGDPFDPATEMGPLANALQFDRVLDFVGTANAAGLRRIAGGEAIAALAPGFFVQPTVFADVPPDSGIAQNEVFGPVLSIIPYETEDAAIRIANGTPYGLNNRVWSQDPDRAVAFARRLQSGHVNVNGGGPNWRAPRGGWKCSGLGYEVGAHGILDYLGLKSINLPS
jgi:acyl-CoA reductase-like NAD-dependent aldehyde dehydrogenase